MTKQGQWQWQEEGTSWKGVGIYHATLTVTSREPLLGRLVIPDQDPARAMVEPTELGRAVLECQRSLPQFCPEIQILQYCLMPDHLHSIWYVRRPMEKSIRYVAQGFWRGAKKAGRAYSYLQAAACSARLVGGATNESAAPSLSPSALPSLSSIAAPSLSPSAAPSLSPIAAPSLSPSALPSLSPIAAPSLSPSAVPSLSPSAAPSLSPSALPSLSPSAAPSLSSIAPASSRENPLRARLGDEAYYALPPLFTEVPFLRPLSRRGQLRAMIRYVQLNPQRLATKRLMPGFFRVQEGIEIAGRTYAAVGNIALLQAPRFAAVHVRSKWVKAAEQGDTRTLRDYMNGCVLAARRGTVMVSPFISTQEKEVKAVLLAEQHPFIVLADNGFRDYYKPPGDIFEAVAAGRALLLSPWPYDAGKRHISRADCVALNTMAEEIAAL